MTKSQLPISNERSTAVVRRLHANGAMITNTKHSYRNGACVRHASMSRLEAIPVGDGYTFSLTALSDVEHLPAADRTR